MKFLAVFLAVLFMGSVLAFASDTGNPTWTTPITPLNPLLDEYATHHHGYDMYERKTEVGIIGEVTLYRDEVLGVPYSLGGQSQYDFNNNDWAFYGKVSLDLSGKVKDLLGLK